MWINFVLHSKMEEQNKKKLFSGKIKQKRQDLLSS